MGNYAIRMRVEIADDTREGPNTVVEGAAQLPWADAVSIDAVERTVLRTGRRIMRVAVGKHLETLSRRMAEGRAADVSGVIRENENEYRVEGEVGRIRFRTHQVRVDGKVVYDTSKDVFGVLRSREWYRTEGFNEVAFDLVQSSSYRKGAATLNRVRGQEEQGTPSRTLACYVELEGMKVQAAIRDQSQDALKEHGFTVEGNPVAEDRKYGMEAESAALPGSVVVTAMNEYNQGRDDSQRIDGEQVQKLYEDPEKTVNISLDEVGVKKQKDNGRSAAKIKKENREYVRNTIGHVEHGGKRYILSAISVLALLPLLVGFLLHNKLLRYHLQFFVDGARDLQSAILKAFSWVRSFTMILDWYHLKDKCKRELSLALRNSRLRNSLLERILPLLWLGKTDATIRALKRVRKDHLKEGKTTEGVIAYLERNRNNIPCYALRKQLGLRNSSNKGEKANDLAVSDRQKHNGMSWSRVGSPALAAITILHLNKEQKNWYRHSRIDYKLVEPAAA